MQARKQLTGARIAGRMLRVDFAQEARDYARQRMEEGANQEPVTIQTVGDQDSNRGIYIPGRDEEFDRAQQQRMEAIENEKILGQQSEGVSREN